jgi:hypothetical protein
LSAATNSRPLHSYRKTGRHLLPVFAYLLSSHFAGSLMAAERLAPEFPGKTRSVQSISEKNFAAFR